MKVAIIESIFILLLFLVSFVLGLTRKNASVNQIGRIFPDTSRTLKALCCILIIIEHYALRVDEGVFGKIMIIGGGNFSLQIFLFLSAYGITQSEYNKNLGIVDFFHKRVMKVAIPYAIWVTLFFFIYWQIEADPKEDEMKVGRVTPSFATIGSHQIGVIQYFRYLFGIDSFCGHLWFVGVTLYHYVAFFVCKTLFSLQYKRIKCFCAYALLMGAFCIFTMVLQFPAHYWRNLWALVLGLFVALFENRLLQLSNLKKIFSYLLGNILVTTYLIGTHSNRLIEITLYVLVANIGVVFVLFLNRIFTQYTLKVSSPIGILVVLSYSIYLVHGMLLTLEWWYIGFQSLILIVVSSIIFGNIYEKLQFHFKQIRSVVTGL